MKKLILTFVWLLSAEWVFGAVKVYSHPVEPRLHPDDARRLVKPPDAQTFGNKMQFMALRGLPSNTYTNLLDRYVKQDRLGDVIWAHSGILFNTNIAEQVAELKRRNLYLFDLWGFVPGSGPGTWSQFKRPAGVTEMFERELGDHWLGMDNGEQDGRYVGGYAPQLEPFGADRFHQYLNFQRHFERMDELLGNKMATLVSLNFGHYFLRECCYTLIGAETAQGLPNSQIYYAFIRGAGKQYGVPWFGNVSIYNRWGWKGYPQKDARGESGTPTGGTSLALMKKLMYAQLFYNSSVFGYEAGCYWNGKYTKDGKDELSPIGRMQRDAVRWYDENGTPGIQHTPVAVMLDFYSGWSFPRHLYTSKVYTVWGGLPYEAGDYLTDGIFDLLYPGYEDSSYFHNERGFNTPTPYGDIADGILSDAPAWVLRQYPLVVLGGRLTPSAELRDTLVEYVRQGGELALTDGNIKGLFGGNLPDAGTGRFTRIPGGDWGVTETAQCPLPVANRVDAPLAKPYPLRPEARAALDEAFRRQRIFGTSSDAVDDGLSIVTCRRAKGDYTVLILNNTWEEKPFNLTCFAGHILSRTELQTDVSERTAIGFAHTHAQGVTIGRDTDTTIAAAGVRIFRVKTDEGASVAEIPYAKPTPNAGRHTLVLRGNDSIKEQILARPTFFRHFDSVIVDARYFLSRDKKELASQADWVRKQGLGVWVDLAPLLNLYPDLRLLENDPNETPRVVSAFTDLLEKMEILGAKDLLVALHRVPENNISADEAFRQMEVVLRRLCQDAAKRHITVYLRQSPLRKTGSLDELARWVARIKEPNFKPAPSLAATLLANGGEVAKTAQAIATCDAPVWLVAAPARDVNGQLYSIHRPVAGQSVEPALQALRAKNVRLVYDAIYPDTDAEYRDARLVSGN